MVQLQALLNYQEIDGKLYKMEREFASCDEKKEYGKVKKYLIERSSSFTDDGQLIQAVITKEHAEKFKRFLRK